MRSAPTAAMSTALLYQTIAPSDPPSEDHLVPPKLLPDLERLNPLSFKIVDAVYAATCPYCGAHHATYADFVKTLEGVCKRAERAYGSWTTDLQYVLYAKIAGDYHLVGINAIRCDLCEDRGCKIFLRETICHVCKECGEEFRCEVPNHEQKARQVHLGWEGAGRNGR